MSRFFCVESFPRVIFRALILAIPLMFLLPGWQGFVYSPLSIFSDLSISHYPNAVFLLKSLQLGQFPLWSSTILSGYPFAANPLSGIWYLPGWLAYIFPLPMGFNICVLIHLLWSGIGMWLFLKELGVEEIPAIAGAILWECLPKNFSHFGAGHLTLIYAVSWTPWLALAEIRSQSKLHKYGWVFTGILFGLIILADVRWAGYASIFWLTFSFYTFFYRVGGGNLNLQKSIGWIFKFGRSCLLALFISAPLLFPLLEYVPFTSRSNLKASENLVLSISPLQLLSLLSPLFQGYAEWVFYIGGIALVAIVWMALSRKSASEVGFWLVTLALSLWISLGRSMPFNDLLFRLPGMDLLRVPARFMFLFGFAGAVILARFLNADVVSCPGQKHTLRNLLLFSLGGFAWVLSAATWIITSEPPLSLLWGSFFLTAGLVLLWLRIRRILSPILYIPLVMTFMLADVGTVSYSQFVYRPSQEVLAQGKSIIDLISTTTEEFRIYTPSNTIPQHTAALRGLQMVNGIDPLQLIDYVEYMQLAGGFTVESYSVTLPPFKRGDPEQDTRGFVPRADLLGVLNVRYVISSYPIQADGLKLLQKHEMSWIYENQAYLPRAWVQPYSSEFGREIRTARILLYTPNQIEIEAEGPGTLVLSELNYPGWVAMVDGKKQPMISPYSLLRGVNLPAGKHHIQFSFQPISVYAGLAMAVVGWVCAGILLYRNLRKTS